MSRKSSLLSGNSGDSFLLMFVRMATIVFGLLITRVLSGHFSLQVYGTYSQILLLDTTIQGMTTLGMIDGINYFFCRETDEKKRNAYISTIFFLQYAISAVVAFVLLLCTNPICRYFDNAAVKSLIIYAAMLPVLQNSLAMLQVLFVAIGKARQIAIRNLIISIAKLGAVALACYVFNHIAVVLFCQVLLDIFQVLYFYIILRKNRCKINIFRFDITLFRDILAFCIPMAMFTVIKNLNRSSDKLFVSYFTDTETLAVYTNASKILPLDIVTTSFCTVLSPFITRYVARKNYSGLTSLYKSFLEVAYITTTIFVVGAICVAPELMEFLYTKKYVLSDFSVPVFVIYLLIDIINVFNITLILCAAGKTKITMYISMGSLIGNVLLNLLLYYVFGVTGFAIATLLVSLIQGLVILGLSAREVESTLGKMFNFRFLLRFVVQILAGAAIALLLRKVLLHWQIYYFFIMATVFALFAGAMLCLNWKRLRQNFRIINQCKNNTDA